MGRSEHFESGASEHRFRMQYDPPEMGRAYHRIRAFSESGAHMGDMIWNAKHVLNVGVPEQFQRRGVATAMWEHAHQIAGGRIPKPKHSPQRTNAGDAWARKVGGKLPRRKAGDPVGRIGDPIPAGRRR